ncbi:MAG: hypothetical protein ACJ8CB_15355 [Ktedonobacteraceae bacterium]
MALFGRHHLPSRSALSRFLAALDQGAVEALRTQFQEDLLQRTPPFPLTSIGFCGSPGKGFRVVGAGVVRRVVETLASPSWTRADEHARATQASPPRANATSAVWPPSMGTKVVYEGLSRIGFHASS